MKRNLLILGALLCWFSSLKSQTLNASPTTITTGGQVTVTGNSESIYGFFSSLYLDAILVTSGTSGSVTGTISQFVPFNPTTYNATSFKLTLTNSSSTPTTVLVRLMVTRQNNPNNTNTQYARTIEQSITVNPQVTTTYYNAARSQVFNKNNCGSGYVGSAVTYSVPANQYSSTVSQADADGKAQNQINLNGQSYANTNGTCGVDYSNWVTMASFPMVSDDFSIDVGWNKNLVNTPTVKMEIYQNGVFKGVIATGVPNTGLLTGIHVIQLLQLTGTGFEYVKVKLISEADPSIFDFSYEEYWIVD
ncbi:DUF5977 domain-containing protein [Pedobacter sp. PWIIR3]